MQQAIYVIAVMMAVTVVLLRHEPRAMYRAADALENWGSLAARWIIKLAQWLAALVIKVTQLSSRRMRIRAMAKADADAAYRMAYAWHERVTFGVGR